MATDYNPPRDTYRVRNSQRMLAIEFDHTYLPNGDRALTYHERDARGVICASGFGLTRAQIETVIEAMRTDFPSLYRANQVTNVLF